MPRRLVQKRTGAALAFFGGGARFDLAAPRSRPSVSCIQIFTVRLHVMQRTVLLSQFCLSVCLSVRPSDACIVTKLNNALRIF